MTERKKAGLDPLDLLFLVVLIVVFCGVGIPVAATHGWVAAAALVFAVEALLIVVLRLIRRRRQPDRS